MEDAARARSSERGSGDPAARDHARNDTSELESVHARLELCEAERRGSRTRATAPETDSPAEVVVRDKTTSQEGEGELSMKGVVTGSVGTARDDDRPFVNSEAGFP